MIVDRTNQDVQEALRIRREKVQKSEQLTDSEIEILERGMITINTLNRIENKQIELVHIINELGYYCPEISSKEWTSDDIFNLSDLERLIENSEILRNAFLEYSTTPPKPSPLYHYKQINALEQILLDLETMQSDIISNYRECGTIECGEE